MGTEGVINLCKGNWPKLRDLFISNMYVHLDRNDIDIDGYASVANGNWNELKMLKIYNYK